MDGTRHTCWSITINNPTPADEESIALVRQKGWKVEGQLEQGSEGTPHYQLMVHTGQQRFAAVKKAFPRAHIEPARNVAALATYVAKVETRVGALPIGQDKYPSQAAYFELVWEEILACPDEPEFRRLPSGRFATAQIRSSLVVATRRLICKGYHVENLACNPMTIQAWKSFHLEFLHRKTNRQTDMRLVAEQDSLASQHNHAHDHTRT